MADTTITVYKPVGDTVAVFDNPPPVDQTAKIAAALAAANQSVQAAQAALTAAQQVVSVLSAP